MEHVLTKVHLSARGAGQEDNAAVDGDEMALGAVELAVRIQEKAAALIVYSSSSSDSSSVAAKISASSVGSSG